MVGVLCREVRPGLMLDGGLNPQLMARLSTLMAQVYELDCCGKGLLL